MGSIFYIKLKVSITNWLTSYRISSLPFLTNSFQEQFIPNTSDYFNFTNPTLFRIRSGRLTYWIHSLTPFFFTHGSSTNAIGTANVFITKSTREESGKGKDMVGRCRWSTGWLHSFHNIPKPNGFLTWFCQLGRSSFHSQKEGIHTGVGQADPDRS